MLVLVVLLVLAAIRPGIRELRGPSSTGPAPASPPSIAAGGARQERALAAGHDGIRDTVGCGSDVDTADVDALDVYDDSCETTN